MKKILLIIVTFALIFFLGCDEESPVESGSNLFVVSAFLYQGEPVQNVQITSTLLLGSTDTVAPPINSAIVELIKEGNKYSLTQTLENPGYYNYAGNDLMVSPGDQFRIEVTYDGRLAYGETFVPNIPENIALSSTTLQVPEFSFGGFGGGSFNIDDYSILLSWDNFDASYYYVVIDNLETDPEPIFEDLPFGEFRRFISSPSKTAEYRISPVSVIYFGDHQAILYKVNQEYADLYESREQDSRNLQEPLTNMVNAFGVFSAFASDTVYFNVIPE